MGYYKGPQNTFKYFTNDIWNGKGVSNFNKVYDPAGIFGGGDDEGGNPYAGMAQYPTYVGMDTNDPSFHLASQFGGQNAPLDKFSSESMRSGLAPSTQFALQQNTLGANAGRDQARKMAQGMGQDASAKLSMQGGLGAGAQERIGKYSTNVGMEGANQVDANAGANRGNLLIADEAARNGNLQSAAGLNMNDRNARYSMQAQDADRLQGELGRRNAFNMGGYQSQMAAWGAGKTADATAKSGKKS